MWNWLASEWQLAVPLLMGWLALCWAMPQGKARTRIPAALLGLAAFVVFTCGKLVPGENAWQAISLYARQLPFRPDLLRDVMFYTFSTAAIGGGALMITDRNPVYAALWFAVATLGVCGLFLLSSAPFLSAATIIVYAGAIVVTFLFVIMLAQQAGKTNYDQRAYQPAAASLAAILVLACLLITLQSWGKSHDGPTPIIPEQLMVIRASEDYRANRFSQSDADELGSLRHLGRSLFTDYLYAVELAGSILLIATIGAIAIAPRRSQGTF